MELPRLDSRNATLLLHHKDLLFHGMVVIDNFSVNGSRQERIKGSSSLGKRIIAEN